MGVQMNPLKIIMATVFLDLLTAWSDEQHRSSLLTYIVNAMQFKILHSEADVSIDAYKASQGIKNLSLGHSILPDKGMVFFSFTMPRWTICASKPDCHGTFRKL